MLQRATFGVTEADQLEVATRGWEGWVAWQLQPQNIADTVLDQRLAAYDWLVMDAHDIRLHPTLESWEIAHEARAVRLLRATFSKRQLFERLVEFWTDHFNIYGAADDTSDLKPVDDRAVIRQHALGKFRDLLHASSKSPAMLAYLDNNENVSGHANENYAREVMELHTLGVTGPYTESDVREVARCLTGWSYRNGWEPGRFGEFLFRSQSHDNGPKTVLGLAIAPSGGITDGERVFDLIADHPSTKQHICRKLARWFLCYNPPASIVNGAIAVWDQTDGTIAEIVRYLLSPATFRTAEPWFAPKLKRPFEWVVSLFRATSVALPAPHMTIYNIWSLAQVPFQWAPPNGYPDAAGPWAAHVQPRWLFALNFGHGYTPSLSHSVADLRALLGTTPRTEWIRRLDQMLCGGLMNVREREQIQAYINTFSSSNDQSVAEAFGLVASSPSFNRY